MTAGEAQTDRGLLDTSVFIAQESSRPLSTLPRTSAVSVVTIVELRLGVLMASDPAIRSLRIQTLSAVEARFEPLPIDVETARSFAEIVAEARRQGRRPRVMDVWIAATAITHGLPVFTQDGDFAGIPRVRVVRV